MAVRTTRSISDSGGPSVARRRVLVPRRVYDELNGSVATETYGRSRWQEGFDEGWIALADDLDYANPVVSTVMDETRRFIASETNRDEDVIEKADTALVALAGQLLDGGRASRVVILTTDKPLGEAAETLLPRHGFENRIEYRYVASDYLDRLAPDEFRDGSR
ncbi:hypothetical protein [Halorussus caseinilyticus]|uniref:NYN domain-containing protein n=1 Tax=Halorussus caseinilyticus TaxID=3034025 RepID=A0ABD5WNI3_9EURY